MTRNIAINAERLWDSLMQMARIGATPKGGVCRVALTDLDRQGRDLFRRWCEEAGCTVGVDQFGNMFARRPGRRDDLAPVATGSHLDSQPTGGRFDGVYGVLAGLEVIRTLNDHDIQTETPVEVVVWTNEEGARFPPAMVGSGVHVGEFTLDYACGQTDREGVTQGEALAAIGYKGEEPIGSRRFSAFFETHIEQGPILEASNKTIGVVQGVQGIRWYDVSVVGAECHAGPTPMELRRDSLAGAAEMLALIYDIATLHAPAGRCTVGEFRIYPGSRNTVPGTTEFSVDMRHPDPAHIDRMHGELLEVVAEVGKRRHLEARIEEIWYSPPIAFDPQCVEAVAKGAELLGYDAMPITSGAGHDSVYVSRVAPTAMIFVPCKDGISHAEIEDATSEHCAAGANVLLHAMLERAADPAG